MDAGTVAAAALLEAAQNNQKIVEASTERLEALIKVLRELPREVTPDLKAAIEKAHREELAATRQEFQALTTNLRYARERMARLWLFIGTGIVVAAVLAVAALLFFVLPSPKQIGELQAEKDQLAATIADLKTKGGNVQLKSCAKPGQKARLCAAVDPSAGEFGKAEGEHFMVLKGY